MNMLADHGLSTTATAAERSSASSINNTVAVAAALPAANNSKCTTAKNDDEDSNGAHWFEWSLSSYKARWLTHACIQSIVSRVLYNIIWLLSQVWICLYSSIVFLLRKDESETLEETSIVRDYFCGESNFVFTRGAISNMTIEVSSALITSSSPDSNMGAVATDLPVLRLNSSSSFDNEEDSSCHHDTMQGECGIFELEESDSGILLLESDHGDLSLRRDSLFSDCDGETEAMLMRRRNSSGGEASSSSEGQDNENKEPASPELKEKIIAQVENMFSDDHLAKDGFLLKHCRRRSDGFVSLKLVAGLRKVKQISREFPVILDAVKQSDKLEVNAEGTKVRRKEPLTSELKSLPVTAKEKNKDKKDGDEGDDENTNGFQQVELRRRKSSSAMKETQKHNKNNNNSNVNNNNK